MPDSFSFSCPQCGASFEVPEEYCEQTAECAECNSTFVLPSLEEFQSAVSATCVINTNEIFAEEEANAMEETGTVKIDRASIGMIPEIKDAFDLSNE